MRHYPKNSPRAAARIVALVLLSDGHLCRTEANALQRPETAQRLGLDAASMPDLLRETAEDLLASGAGLWNGAGGLDAAVIADCLADVDQPALQRRVIELCQAVAQADGHLSEGERAVLSVAALRWGTTACVPE
jgi:uncharacterized tellurite resistance protein B-like protein